MPNKKNYDEKDIDDSRVKFLFKKLKKANILQNKSSQKSKIKRKQRKIKFKTKTKQINRKNNISMLDNENDKNSI